MKAILSLMICLVTLNVKAQELFTWSEPASNMAAKSIGIRLTNMLAEERKSNKYAYHLLPELMWGISPKIMVHAEAFLSNSNRRFSADGAAFYLKYRFYSQDDIHSHFRMAAYGKAAINNSYIGQEGINLNGLNSGYEAGLIATKLVNKLAVSTGVGFLYAADNGAGNKVFYDDQQRNAIGYNLSVGQLVLPKEYKDYKQTNLNLMLELLGQTNLGSGRSFLDIAPVVQLIINSQVRVDASYRFQMIKDLQRTGASDILLRLEYNFFNVYR